MQGTSWQLLLWNTTYRNGLEVVGHHSYLRRQFSDGILADVRALLIKHRLKHLLQSLLSHILSRDWEFRAKINLRTKGYGVKDDVLKDQMLT